MNKDEMIKDEKLDEVNGGLILEQKQVMAGARPTKAEGSSYLRGQNTEAK